MPVSSRCQRCRAGLGSLVERVFLGYRAGLSVWLRSALPSGFVGYSKGVPLFIQLKRSMVVRHPAAREFKSLFFPLASVCRINLHAKHHFPQHLALQALDTSGAEVIYATSQIESPDELARHAAWGSVISAASVIFEPNEP